MVSLLIATVLLTRPQSGANFVANAAFVQNLDGWAGVWAREAGAAQVSIVSGRTETSKAVLVKSTGSLDWALAQQAQIPVNPRDMFEISAWMRSDGGAGAISTVSRDAKGGTIQWDLGSVGPKTSGWQFVHRAFVVPSNCRTLQFRLVGTGVGQTWMEAPSLLQKRTIPSLAAPPVALKGQALTLAIKSDGAILATPKTGKPWRYRPWSENYVTTSLKKVDPHTAEVELFDLANELPITLQLQVDPLKQEVTVTCKAAGSMDTNVTLPGSLVTEHGQWVVLPMNEGIQFPVEDPAINGWSLITYGGHGLCMPWSGAYDPTSGAGTMTILETPNDADVQFEQEGSLLSYEPRWEASRQSFGYTRKLRFCYFDHGGYVAMAKRYRAYAKATSLFKTLAAKKAENPNVDRLVGAVNIWNWDMDKVALCREMKQLGIGRVLWSSGGTADQVRAIADMGYLPGRYDIYQDVWDPKNSLSWMNTEGWPQDLVLEPNGDWMKGWAHPDKHPDGTITWYQGGVICSQPGLARAKQKIPADLAKVPYLARFIDTTTASPFRECYNPAHPLTRGQDRQNKMDLLSFCSNDLKQVLGTETGIDPSVPVADYYEGMMSLGPYRLPDAGTFMMEYRKPTPEFLKYQIGSNYRIPLWELVYHECTVSQWYWGDATNKDPEFWDQRDLLNILYGTAPLLMFDKDRWDRDKYRMLRTYRNVCEWTRKLGYDEMLTHEYLTPDHTVQKTTWSSGRSVIVNFGETSFEDIPTMSFKKSEKGVSHSQ